MFIAPGGASGAALSTVLGVERSLSGRRWLARGGPEDRLGLALAQRAGLPELVARLLAARGVDPDQAADFLAPTLRALLPDPSVLRDMDQAAERLARAAERGDTVGIFGDYDVDGACGTAILTLLLRALGCAVLTHIPDRMTEGYGPNAPALDAMRAQGAGLLVCVDCGTAAHAVLAGLTACDIIILDHHACEGAPPPVLAAVNPNRLDCASGLHGICAAAVAFLAAVATVRVLRRRGWFARRAEPDLMGLLDLVALATVCDVMPLTGVNRALVGQGLRVMQRRARPGLAALLALAGGEGAPGVATCGYALGPRINAAGRIGEAGLGLRLLLTEDPVEAAAIAQRLDETNRTRREVEGAIMEAALAQAEALHQAGHAALLVHAEGWHAGVVGIVAGRLKERFNRPALAGALTGGVIKGSARSVPGVDLGRAIVAARSAGLLLSGGGHAMAAGFSLDPSRLAGFRAFLDERCALALALPRAADLALDGTLAVQAATAGLAAQIARLAPYGPGNEEPAFALSRARVVRGERIGRQGATVRSLIEGEGGGPRLKALRFRAGEDALSAALLQPGAPLHLAGHLRAESWNGAQSLSFFVSDAAPA